MKLEVKVGAENPCVLDALKVLADLLIRLDRPRNMGLHGGGETP